MRKIVIVSCVILCFNHAFSQENEQKIQNKEKLSKIIDVNNQKAVPSSGESVWGRVPAGISYRSGYVGIGTSTPSQRLHVEGNLRLNNNGGYIYQQFVKK